MVSKLLLYVCTFALLCGCAALKKDNEPQSTVDPAVEVRTQLDVYRPLIDAQLDAHGLVRLGGSIGDSTLFSCLALVAGGANFDPVVFLTPEGKPLRHPEIAPDPTGKSSTPISKDMVDGFLWCVYAVGHKGDMAHARELTESLISFGKAHSAPEGWWFCTADDRAAYHMSDADWLGKCLMPPAMIKDIYRLEKWAGGECDQTCKDWMAVGVNVPANNTGFERHLAVIGTVRNGLVEGGINDNSLKIVLENAKNAEPHNALYQGAFHLFTDGVQADCFAQLKPPRFPADALPGKAQFCTPYLFQRDEAGNPDWLPCPNDTSPDGGRGVDYAFAAAVCLSEVK